MYCVFPECVHVDVLCQSTGNLLFQAEFMEHDERPLPIDIRLLGALAEKVRIICLKLYGIKYKL